MSLLLALVALTLPSTSVGLGMREYRFSVLAAGPGHAQVVRVLAEVRHVERDAPGMHAGAVRRAGTYRLVCLKPGHAAKGMRATLRVTRRR